MDEPEFRNRENYTSAFKRQCELLKNNYAVFMKRARNPEYGTEKDRADALRDAEETARKYKHYTGTNITA